MKAAEYPVYALTTSELDERRRALSVPSGKFPRVRACPHSCGMIWPR